jgi:hypothetical protein
LSSSNVVVTGAPSRPGAPHRRPRVGRDVATANSIGKSTTESGGVVSFRSEPRELLLGAEDDELAHLDPILAQRLAQLVERRLDWRGLRYRVASSSRHFAGV